MNEDPLVSCLMVTGAGGERFQSLTAAIHDYCQQTYRHTELVIVMDNPSARDQARLEELVMRIARSDIRVWRPPGKMPLGALRNLSMDLAKGDFVCLWDDDDIHHPRRVELQIKHLHDTGARAVLLADCLHHFLPQGRCYWVNWQATRFGGLPGTLLTWKHHGLRYPESGPYASSGEDTDFLQRLAAKVGVGYLRAPPFLYVYRFHGKNTWGVAHHAMLAVRFSESGERLVKERSAIVSSLVEMEVGVPRLTMFDGRGAVFSLQLADHGPRTASPAPQYLT